MTPPSPIIKPGDVVLDLAQGTLMQVVEDRGTVSELRDEEGLDLAEYNPLFQVQDHESAYKCVYLNTDLTSDPSRSYDFPESRLVRYPVEVANEDLERVQDRLVRETYVKVFAAVDAETADDLADKLFENGLGRLAPGEEEVVNEALELAEVERDFTELEPSLKQDLPNHFEWNGWMYCNSKDEVIGDFDEWREGECPECGADISDSRPESVVVPDEELDRLEPRGKEGDN